MTSENGAPSAGDNLAEFFAASPLRGSRLEIERPQDGPREITL
jgi:hypothetical protein